MPDPVTQSRTYYRCSARTLVAGSPMLERHPNNVHWQETPVVEQLNTWLGGLFDPAHRERTVATFLQSQRKGASPNEREVVERRLNDAERKLRRLQDAIKAGS
ncbi:hypothetical protein E1161_04555 [Saccharopolyspora aridisoli]|uniref:Recombinase zinc beta ribbon domain-containing protein n=1 Tax=Saccharopolyspora aridisoli TaxID=2530385 RepID=A0A4R4V1H0_9PSEU|nr:hypothetical protein [Saccharopolyspora aridisoli]TDC95454.1 hypothetical protein E1161_04555 [Saccharopolyspora aridisoli]